MKRIYMDFAASTPVDPRVIEAMAPYWRERYGNPGAIHEEGVTARRALEHSRQSVARAIGARAEEIIFTANGTESNAIAIFGVLKRYELAHEYDIRGAHFVTSTIEHPSILEGFRALERRGARVSYIGIDRDGRFDLKALEKALETPTLLVSLMYVNNEVGTIEPIREAAKLIRAARTRGVSVTSQQPVTNNQSPAPYFHTDASQAPLWLSMNVAELGVDLLTIDGQKMMGPKGVGALFVREGTPIAHPLFSAGKQERGLRSGTEPVPLIVGLSRALELAEAEREDTVRRLSALRDYFFEEVVRVVPGTEINGSREQRIANNVHLSIPGSESEELIIALDSKGVAVSARSACISGGEGSYVVRAMGKGSREATSSLRFSMGPATTREDIDFCVRALVEVVRAAPRS